MKLHFYINGLSALILTTALGFFVFFNLYRFPFSTEDRVAQARSEQSAVKAGVEQFGIDPHDVDQIFKTQGTLNDQPFVLYTVNLRNRDQYFFHSTTGEASENPPDRFIFPSSPLNQPPKDF